MNKYIYIILLSALVLCTPTGAQAHEAWLLTPAEMIELATAPLPEAFVNGDMISFSLGLFISIAFLCGLVAEYFWKPYERKLDYYLEPHAKRFGPLIIRVTLALFMIYAALGQAPRHGTSIGTQPTLFVPDMELRLLSEGWGFLSSVEIILGLMLLYGVFTRVAALGVILLAFTGLALFGSEFLPYFGHAFAPGVYLLCIGGGMYYVKLKLPEPLDRIRLFFAKIDRGLIYQSLLFLVGINFAFLGFRYKFLEPNLLIKILEIGNVPNFGIPYEYMAVMMAFIETTAGVLIALRLLVRPLALFLIGAMMFLALSLGESFIFHSNIFGIMFVFALFGDGSRFKPAASHIKKERKHTSPSFVYTGRKGSAHV